MPSTEITLRIVSGQHGTHRVTLKPGSDTAASIYEAAASLLKLRSDSFILSKSRSNNESSADALPRSSSTRLTSLNLKHGDQIFVHLRNNNHATTATVVNGNIEPQQSSNIASSSSIVILDEVDEKLSKREGKIERPMSERANCKHGSGGACFHCMPLEPWDEEYLRSREQPIKFLAFHSYVKKLMAGVSKGKFVQLEDVSCKIKQCDEHLPWPKGICTKCQPNAVTLNRQTYRHVDYVQFENSGVVNRFLNFWRESGFQRVGIMIGKYDEWTEVPLGIKAVVTAIYEPPQLNTEHSVELLADPNESALHELCQMLGVVPVGWIVTDLIPLDKKTGTVEYVRGSIDTYFLSAEECIQAAVFQNKYPNKCRYSRTGLFGSKFVTVVVSGNACNQIHFEAYQVSNQCMALVRDECLIPTVDCPELGYVKESSDDQYVPDVFYKMKDQYGNDVTQLARPLPVEYLLVDLPTGYPINEMHTFAHDEFSIENRFVKQSINDVKDVLAASSASQSNNVLAQMNDFHLLFFLFTAHELPIRGIMGQLIDAIRSNSAAKQRALFNSHEFVTFDQILASYTMEAGSQSPSSAWACQHCTFRNPENVDTCGMCSLPR